MLAVSPYQTDDDFFRMRRLVERAWAARDDDRGPAFHVGDLTWQRFMYPRDIFPPEERIALWPRADGELDGFAWFYPKSNELAWVIDPTAHARGSWRALVEAMLPWAGQRSKTSEALMVPLLESDTETIGFLTERGFARSDEMPMLWHRRNLANEVEAPVVADGYSLGDMSSDERLADRVEIHREVWHPSRFTLAGYQQLRTSPGYDPSLDIVALAPDGEIAAYAICWIDEVNRTAEFEPVGAREAHRGKGLAKAVLLETMRRLREREINTVFVLTGEDRLPACHLYLSAGFEVIDRWVTFQSPA